MRVLKFIWIYGQKATFGLAMRTVYTDMREGYTRMDARAIRTHGKNIIILKQYFYRNFRFLCGPSIHGVYAG